MIIIFKKKNYFKASEFVPVMIQTSETNKFIMCTLSKEKAVFQQQLELELNAGECVNFSLGAESGSVHLTGLYINEHVHGDSCGQDQQDMDEYLKKVNEDYFNQDDDDDEDDEDGDEFDEDDDDEDEDDDDEDDDDEDDDDDDEDDEEDEEEEEVNGENNLNIHSIFIYNY
jgi:hypothetical protein